MLGLSIIDGHGKFLFVFVEGPSYAISTPGKSLCCVLNDEKPHLNGIPFENCECAGKKDSFCKTKCDTDLNCMGYTYWHTNALCLIATTSTCPTECNKGNRGMNGKLDPTAVCGSNPENWIGCFIKQGKTICN